jgi:tripartite ATP-independent transporter DctP family solute receptor
MNTLHTTPRRAVARMLVCAVACALMASTAMAQATETKVLRLGIGLGADSPKGKAVVEFGRLVSAYTNGTIKVELHASGALGNDVTMTQAAREGKLEMTAPDSSTLATLDSRFSAINYPFTFNNESEADAILDGPWGQRLLDDLQRHGLIGLAYWENGFRNMTNSRRSLSSLSDFDGVRMRVMQNPMLVDSFNQLGFTAVPLPFTKVYDAMKTQEVDGQENPLSTILASKFYEVQKHLTLSRHVYSAHVMLLSEKVWRTLSPQQQQAMRRAARETRDFERRLNRESEAEALAALKGKGMVVAAIPRADAERIRNRLRSVFDKYNGEIGAGTMIDLYVQLGQLRTAAAANAGTPAAATTTVAVAKEPPPRAAAQTVTK